MLRLKAERRSLRKVSGASASESVKTPDISYLSTRTAPSNAPASDPRTTRPSSNFYRGLRYAILLDLFLVAFLLAVVFIVGYIAVHVPTAVVILGGLALVGLVVIRGASPS